VLKPFVFTGRAQERLRANPGCGGKAWLAVTARKHLRWQVLLQWRVFSSERRVAKAAKLGLRGWKSPILQRF
jgi:hypothetical protein